MITRGFAWLTTLALSRPRWMLAGYAALALAMLPFLARLHLEADVRDTLPPDLARLLERHNTLFGSADLALLLIQAPAESRATLVAFGAALRERLLAVPLIASVEYGVSPALGEAIERLSLDYAPLFVTPAQLDAFDQLLTPEGIQTQLHKTMLQLSAMSTGLQDQLLLSDPLQLRRFAFARLLALRGAFRFDPTSPYFLSPDGRALLIKIVGRQSVHDMAGAKATVQVIQQHSAALQGEPAFQSLTVQATGGYFFAAESEQVIRRDITISVHLTILSICALLIWSLRRWSVMWYAFVPTLLSLVLALGCFAALRPSLNALTLGCIASLLGFGMDYTVYILQRAFHEQGRGLALPAALRLAVVETAQSLFLAALTSMACFLAFHTAQQRFLHDMGLLAALGMGLSCLLSITFLPALLVCLPLSRRTRLPRTLGLPACTAVVLRYPGCTLGLSGLCALAAIGALYVWPPGFETDLRNIHAAHSPTLGAQETIARLFGGSQEPLLLLVEDTTEGQVVEGLARVQPMLTAMVQEGLLAAVTSPALLYPAPASQRALLQRLRLKDPQQLLAALSAALAAAGFDAPSTVAYVETLRRTLNYSAVIDLATFRSLGFDALLRPLLAHDAAGAVGVALLFPVHDLWTRAARDAITQRVNRALQGANVRGTLSGLYTISAESASRLGSDFLRITLVAFLSVILLVFVSVRSLQLTVLVLLPVLCGALWAAGIFVACGLQLNFMTICLLPMLLATSSDYGIYIVQRFIAHGRTDVQEAMGGIGLGVILSALTTLEGFGTLALSVNRGIASVGLVSLLGVSLCFLAALCTLPAALQVWGRRQRPREESLVD
ncbi:MAG: MMPL family transporter [Candidatus Tectimicrobiota bacterium]